MSKRLFHDAKNNLQDTENGLSIRRANDSDEVGFHWKEDYSFNNLLVCSNNSIPPICPCPGITIFAS